MSQVSDTHGILTTIATAQLSGHKQLANPYDLPSNPAMALQKGWGIRYGSGANSFRHLSNLLTIAREFTIVVTRQFIANDVDPSARVTVEKALMEDAILVAKAVEADPNLTATAMKAEFLGDTGIEFLPSGEFEGYGYLTIGINFAVEYRETL